MAELSESDNLFSSSRDKQLRKRPLFNLLKLCSILIFLNKILHRYTGTSTQELSPEEPILGKSKQRSCLFVGAAQEWIMYESGAPLANLFFAFASYDTLMALILRYFDTALV